MSSHAIVKDNQEPALIIANGEACDRNLLDGLLEWSPYIVVLDGALERVLDLKIKFDVLLGDFDRLKKDHPFFSEQGDIEIIHTPDQDKTDLEKAMDFVFSKGLNMVNIVWATGWRMDHTFNNIITLAKYYPQLQAVMIDNYSRIFVVPKDFKKYYTKGQVISLFPLGEVHGISTSGLMYNLTNESLIIPGRTGSSNECSENGMVEISYKEGILILMECRD